MAMPCVDDANATFGWFAVHFTSLTMAAFVSKRDPCIQSVVRLSWKGFDPSIGSLPVSFAITAIAPTMKLFLSFFVPLHPTHDVHVVMKKPAMA